MSNNFNKSKQKFTCNEILLAPFENESLLLPKTHNCLYTGLTRAGLGGGGVGCHELQFRGPGSMEDRICIYHNLNHNKYHNLNLEKMKASKGNSSN